MTTFDPSPNPPPITAAPATHTASAGYEAWLRQVHRPAQARRTAERSAAFLLPHLHPGVRLLDAGCGPGVITLGLAEAVATGEAIGIDTSPEAIASACATASSLGRRDVRFLTADVTALPFADASFDAVFCHAVLQHLRDPLSALREFRRVLSPGGVIGVADADIDGSIIAPSDPLSTPPPNYATTCERTPQAATCASASTSATSSTKPASSASVPPSARTPTATPSPSAEPEPSGPPTTAPPSSAPTPSSST